MSTTIGPVEREILDDIAAHESSLDAAFRARPAYQPEDPWAEDYLPERPAPGEDPADEWVSFNPPWLY